MDFYNELSLMWGIICDVGVAPAEIGEGFPPGFQYFRSASGPGAAMLFKGNSNTSCSGPEYIDFVMSWVDKEISDGAIISLQEVSHQWAGVLHAYFAARGYYMVTGLYGNKFNGYMGVAVAVPTAKYDILDVDITRIADTKRLPRKPRAGFVQNIFDATSGAVEQYHGPRQISYALG